MNFNINCSTCSLQFVKTAIFQRDTFTRPLRNFFTASIISFFSFSRLLDTSCWTWHTCSACNCNCSHHVTTHRSTCVSWYPVENYIQVNVCQLVPSWEPHTGQCVSAGTQLRTDGFLVGVKFHCLHALTDGNYHIQMRKKTLRSPWQR